MFNSNTFTFQNSAQLWIWRTARRSPTVAGTIFFTSNFAKILQLEDANQINTAIKFTFILNYSFWVAKIEFFRAGGEDLPSFRCPTSYTVILQYLFHSLYGLTIIIDIFITNLAVRSSAILILQRGRATLEAHVVDALFCF